MPLRRLLFGCSLACASGATAAEPADFPLAPPPDWDVCPLSTVEIALVGDVMMHRPQIDAARTPEGTYDLSGVFEGVAPWLRGADLAIANLETVLGGEAMRGYTGYPMFNSPDTLLDALVDAGVDVLQTANNHSLDRGVEGLQRTLRQIEGRGLARTGTWATPEERERPWARLRAGGLEVAVLASTYGTNGLRLPEGDGWMLSRLQDDTLLRDVEAAARSGADLVVVGVHWGREYVHAPDPWMRELARALVDAGADVVVGTHPHVLQPAEVLRTADALGRPRDALVLYSLGNFVSNQRTPGRDGSVVARVEVRHCARTGDAWLAGVRYTPFWVDDALADGTRAYRVVPTPPLGREDCDDDFDMDARDCAAALRARDLAARLLGAHRLDWGHVDTRPVALGFDWTGAARGWWHAAGASSDAGGIEVSER